MNLKSLRKLLAVGLLTVTGCSWATVSLPSHTNASWQDISSITWSTDGTHWGNSALVVGQTVEFKITMHKDLIGNHYADFVKAWIDWNGDGAFDNSSETLLTDYHVANSSSRRSTIAERTDGHSYDFFSSALTLTNAMIGDHFLLTRVTCSDSLLKVGAGSSYSWANQWKPAYTGNDSLWYKQNFSPTSAYFQGEAQLVRLTVGNAVPEPGTLALLAAAMVGMGLRRKQATRV
jgi:hypothetical protein